jgi:hypothetical protein
MPVAWHDGEQMEIACKHGLMHIQDEDIELRLVELVQHGCPCLFELVQRQPQVVHDLASAFGSECYEGE